MRIVTEAEAGEQLSALLDAVQRDVVVIQRGDREVAALVSMADYEQLRAIKVAEFQRICDDLGVRAKERGMTEEKLAEILADDE